MKLGKLWKSPSFFFFLTCCVLITLTDGFSLSNCTINFPFDYSGHLKVLCYRMGYTRIPSLLPHNTVILDISCNSIPRIIKGDFIRLSNLINLNISHNRISEIHDNALADLPNLEELNLSNNKIKVVTIKLLNGLANLSHLRLDSNDLEVIENQSFATLSNMRFVNLTDNKLKHISELLPVLQVPHLERLYLRKNSFKVLNSSDVPSALFALKKLDLSLNPLTVFKITENIFPSLEYLDLATCFQKGPLDWIIQDKAFLNAIKTLNLSRNHFAEKQLDNIMQSFPSVTWMRLDDLKGLKMETVIQKACSSRSLKGLHFENNHLSILSDRMFRPCALLNELHLRNNGVFAMHKSSFDHLVNLTVLRIQKNRLTQLNGSLQPLPNLQLLDLHLNNIKHLDCSDFTNLTQLRQLYLHRNQIMTIKACVFKDLGNLVELVLTSNSLLTLNDAFTYGTQNLRYLDLRNNKLSCIKNYSFKALHSLDVLILSDNQISDIEPHAFEGLINLEKLHLGSNKITESTYSVFAGMTSLEKLDLSSNYFSFESQEELQSPPFILLSELKVLFINSQRRGLKYMPSNFLKGLKKLEAFYAGNLNVEQLHADTFRYTPNLNILDLTSNNLANRNALTSRLFHPISGLTMLKLSRAHLQSLNFLVDANLSRLTTLRASVNDLQFINQTVIQSLPRLKMLDLQNNSFTCDCNNAWFVDWAVRNNGTQVLYLNRYECRYPLSLSGTNLAAFNTESCNLNYDFLCFICSSSIVILTLVVSFIHHFLKWQLVYAYYLFLAFLNDRKRKQNGNPLSFQYDAFISYNVQDEPWVTEELVPKLEGEHGLRLCLHHRDFQPGKAIIDNIMDGIYNSRKTVCLITHSYLRSVWCSHEIQMASFRLFDEQKDVLILVFLEDIPTHQLSPYYRMRKLVKKWTYLRWPKPGEDTRVFWQKLTMAIEAGENVEEDRQILLGKD